MRCKELWLGKNKAVITRLKNLLDRIAVTVGNAEKGLRVIATLILGMCVVIPSVGMFALMALAKAEMDGLCNMATFSTMMMRYKPLTHEQYHCHEY